MRLVLESMIEAGSSDGVMGGRFPLFAIPLYLHRADDHYDDSLFGVQHR